MVKNTLANAGDTEDAALIPGSGISPGIENDNPLQYSCLKNPIGRGAWWTTVHRVTKSWTQLSMHTQITISLSSTISSRKPHSRRDNSVHRLLTRYGWGFRLSLSLTWSFPCGSVGKESTCNVGRPGFGSWVGKIPWRRKQLPTPVFSPGEFHGLYSPWGCKEAVTVDQFSLYFFHFRDHLNAEEL